MTTDSPERLRQISALFNEAMKLPQESRAGFLDSACVGDADLRRRVAELLMSSAPTDSAAPGSEAKETFGPYRLLQRIGEGGMGEVWLAEQTEPLRRRVALKVIKAGMDTKQVIARFEAERQALALMDHPGIAKVFDAGETPRGLPYFAMEYVAGEAITTYCDRHRLGMPKRLELFGRACEAVQHAHQKGVIHRDLKPSNVMVTIQDGKPVPKVIDFGVAKATAQRLTERTMFTELGVLIGTPEYMSPEQAEMTGLDVDTRTDVYALGVMLYELLTGALPFESKDLREAGYEEIRRRIREVDPPRPSTRVRTLGAKLTEAAKNRRIDPEKLVSRLQGDLDWIVMKALEKDRMRRYGSASELGADLERHLQDQPVLASPPRASYRARKFVRRHRFGVSAAVLGVLVPIFFALAVAAQARKTAREAESKARVAEFLQEVFRISDPNEARGNSVTARELLDRAAARIRESLAGDPGVRAELMLVMGDVYANLGLYAKAEPLLQSCLEARRRLLGPEHPETLRAADSIGRLYFRQGRYQEAEAIHREVLEIKKRMLGPEHPDTLAVTSNLANVYSGLGRLQQAEAIHREVLEVRKRLLGPEHPDTLATMNNLASTYFLERRHREAEEIHREVLEVRRRVLGPDHPDTLAAMNNLAADYGSQGHYKEAEAINREAVEIHERVLGPDHPDTLAAMNNLAADYVDQSRYAEAEALDREVLRISERVLGPDHPRTLWAMNNLANALYFQQRYQEAEAIHREVLKVRKRVLGPEHPDTLSSMHNLAMAYGNQRRYQEAEALYRQAIDISERVLGPDYPDTLVLLYNLGCTAALRGDHAGALGCLRKVVNRGFADPEQLASEPDLKSLQGDPEFETIVAAASKNREAEQAKE